MQERRRFLSAAGAVLLGSFLPATGWARGFRRSRCERGVPTELQEAKALTLAHPLTIEHPLTIGMYVFVKGEGKERGLSIVFPNPNCNGHVGNAFTCAGYVSPAGTPVTCGLYDYPAGTTLLYPGSCTTGKTTWNCHFSLPTSVTAGTKFILKASTIYDKTQECVMI